MDGHRTRRRATVARSRYRLPSMDIGARRSMIALFSVVCLPFGAGYFLSYLYRSINAVIGPPLAREFALGAGDLGLLTSAYFLGFGLFQLPLGVLLDRYGPRGCSAGSSWSPPPGRSSSPPRLRSRF